MCGLAGFSWSDKCVLTYKQKEKLIYLSAMGCDKRGAQSWGFLAANAKGYEVKKGLGPLVSADLKNLIDADAGFGHSRFATSGDITIKNQHPFEYDHIIGAHNGVLYNASKLDELFGKKEVDSEHIFEAIAKARSFAAFRGYGIIEFYNKKHPDSLYLADVGKGDLTVFEIKTEDKKDIQGYFWTSNIEDGRLALAAAGVKEYEPFSLYKNFVYKFSRGVFKKCKKWSIEFKANSPKVKVYDSGFQGGRYWRKNGSYNQERPLTPNAQALLDEYQSLHPDQDLDSKDETEERLVEKGWGLLY